MKTVRYFKGIQETQVRRGRHAIPCVCRISHPTLRTTRRMQEVLLHRPMLGYSGARTHASPPGPSSPVSRPGPPAIELPAAAVGAAGEPPAAPKA